MVTQVARQGTAFHGLRPLDPARDLGQLAQLIEESFGDDLGGEGRAALQDLRLLSRLGPLVFLLERISPELRDYLSGFVWIEDGQVVGNVTVTRVGGLARRWAISNVAVSRAYRRRGIARHLMEAAIEQARLAGGEEVLLRVRIDNDAARQLYESLGFRQVTATTEMELPAVRAVKPVAVSGFTLRRRRHREWRQTMELAHQAIPASLQRLQPVRSSNYRLDPDQRLGRWLGHLFAGRSEHRLVVSQDQRFLATMDVIVSRWRDSHRLKLMIHPDYRGLLDEMLISTGLHLCSRVPGRKVRTKLPLEYEETIATLRRYGFVERRTLALMRLELKNPGR
ncbi:MAG: GNAT family N-acetyltransferase [Anaerolineae bacterium]|nr:GNAT family N-acetyltransferase [Anaerolineae bacterium]